MSVLSYLLLGLLVVVLLSAWYLSYSAARLDRLHARVAGCRSALETRLVRRAEAVLELANSGVLDPASALLLASMAADVLEASDLSDDEQIDLENDLVAGTTAVLAESLPMLAAPGTRMLHQTLVGADRTVHLAVNFHNEAVADVQRMRRKAVVRAFRLAGRARLPQPITLTELNATESIYLEP